MIKSSGNISPGNYHTHEHEITKCLHERKAAGFKDGGGMAAEGKAASSSFVEGRKGLSMRELLTDGLRKLFEKASGAWGRTEAGEEGRSAGKDNEKAAQALTEGGGKDGITVPCVENIAGVLATAVVKPETKTEGLPREEGRKVEKAQGAVSGGLKRGQGGIRGFLKKFEEAAAKAGRFLKKKEHKEIPLMGNHADRHMGNNSFLLDSYNRMGEYSTLAQDRSLEGSFRAKG